jgi:hypothetical protein
MEVQHVLGVAFVYRYHGINHHTEFASSVAHSFMFPHCILVTCVSLLYHNLVNIYFVTNILSLSQITIHFGFSR